MAKYTQGVTDYPKATEPGSDEYWEDIKLQQSLMLQYYHKGLDFESSWEKEKTWPSGVRTRQAEVPNTKFQAYMATIELKKAPEFWAKLIFEAELEQFKKFDSTCKVYEVIENRNADQRVTCTKHTAGFPLADRQFVGAFNRVRTKDHVACISTGIEHPEGGIRGKGVAGNGNFIAYIFEPIDSDSLTDAPRTRAHRYLHIDPSGNISQSMVNLQAAKQVKDFVEVFKKYE